MDTLNFYFGKIGAIKYVRLVTGCGLRDAKYIIEAFIAVSGVRIDFAGESQRTWSPAVIFEFFTQLAIFAGNVRAGNIEIVDGKARYAPQIVDSCDIQRSTWIIP